MKKYNNFCIFYDLTTGLYNKRRIIKKKAAAKSRQKAACFLSNFIKQLNVFLSLYPSKNGF